MRAIIEVTIIGYNTRNLLHRHSGPSTGSGQADLRSGRNPAGLLNMLLAFVPRCGSLFSDWIPAFAGMKVIWIEEKKSETVGIIGRNGSGKSTPLQMISGKFYTWFCFAWFQKTRKGIADVL
jgi:ABC-type microcin C transport system duplicated ATPase subunit YejF